MCQYCRFPLVIIVSYILSAILLEARFVPKQIWTELPLSRSMSRSVSLGQIGAGAFAFLAHSIGALMAIKVAKRARAELGVEPVFVVMLERGAAQHPLFTEKGAQWLRDEPVSFFEVWNPTVFKLYKSAAIYQTWGECFYFYVWFVVSFAVVFCCTVDS